MCFIKHFNPTKKFNLKRVIKLNAFFRKINALIVYNITGNSFSEEKVKQSIIYYFFRTNLIEIDLEMLERV